ncbi:O-antigen ligase family protein [Virgibacillus necropolis]|nr:O-antigen ligase family protein [Virgibacillus necropolis]
MTRFTKYGLIFLLIYFPIRQLLAEIYPVTRFAGDIVILALFAQTAIERKRLLVTRYRFILYFFLFLLVGSVSALLTGVIPIAILMQIRAFLIPALLLFVACEMLITKKDIQHLLWISFFMGCALSIHGLIEKLSHRTLLVPETWQSWELAAVNSDRIYGLVANPNVLAVYLMIVFFLTLYLKKLAANYSVLLNIGLVLLAGTILLTYSRGTLIAFGLALLILSLMKKKWNYLVQTALFFSLAIALVYFPIDQITENTGKETSDRFVDMFSEKRIQQSASGGRVFVVKKGVQIFIDHPVVGTGFGTYGSAATVSFESPIYDRYDIPSSMYADNQYMQILVETGIIGTLFMLLFIYQLAKRTRHSYVFFLMLVGLIGSTFYSMLEDKTFTLYFYLAIGFALNQRRLFHE